MSRIVIDPSTGTISAFGPDVVGRGSDFDTSILAPGVSLADVVNSNPIGAQHGVSSPEGSVGARHAKDLYYRTSDSHVWYHAGASGTTGWVDATTVIVPAGQPEVDAHNADPASHQALVTAGTTETAARIAGDATSVTTAAGDATAKVATETTARAAAATAHNTDAGAHTNLPYAPATGSLIYKTRSDNRYSAKEFGAVGDGVSRLLSASYASLAAAQVDYPAAIALSDERDWAAIQSALLARHSVYCPEGVYRINRTIDARGGSKGLLGDGPDATSFYQTTDNIHVIDIGTVGGNLGVAACLQGFRVDYVNAQPAANTEAKGINMFQLDQGSVIEQIRVSKAASGIYNNPTGYIFSSRISDIEVLSYTIDAMNLSSAGGSITGNVVSNIYTHNTPGTREAANRGIVLAGWTDGVLQQINVEHAKLNFALQINNCRGLTIHGVHIEGFEQRGDFQACIDVLSALTTVDISGLTVENSYFQTASGAATATGIFRMDDGARLRVKGLSEFSNTITTPSVALLYSGSAATSFTAEMLDVNQSGSWALQNMPAGVSLLRRYNGNLYQIESTATGNTTIGTSDSLLLCDATSAGFTVTLPAIIRGARATVKKVDATLNAITVTPPSGTIDGNATKTITDQFESHTYVCDGTNWWEV